MKKSFFIILLVLSIIFPCVVILSGCSCNEQDKGTLTVFVNDKVVTQQNNTVEVEYDQQLDWDNLITVKLLFKDNSQKVLTYGQDGYSIEGLPQELVVNETSGYEFSVTYKDYSAVSLRLLVRKTNPTYIVPNSLVATYGQTLNDIILPQGFYFQDSLDTSVGNAGTNTFLLTYVPQDQQNYNTVRDIPVEILVNKIQLDMANVKWSYVSAFTYDGKEKSVELINLPNEVLATYENNVKIDADNYIATFSLIFDNDIYELINNNLQPLNWEIKKATNEILGSILIEDWTYGDLPNSPSGLNARFGQIEYVYSSTLDGEYSSFIPTNAGTYYIKGVVEEADNYYGVSSQAQSFNINKKQISAPILNNSKLLHTGENLTLTFNYDQEIFQLVGVLQGTEVAQYSFTLSIKDKQNYEWITGGSEDKVYNWEIVSTPFSKILLDGQEISSQELIQLEKVDYSSTMEFELYENYSITINGESVNSFNFSYSQANYEIIVKDNNQVIVFNKTILTNIDVNPVEKIIIGESTQLSYEEFLSNNVVKYGENVQVVIYSKFSDLYVDYANFNVTSDITIKVYRDEEVIFSVPLICDDSFITNIKIDNKSISLEELKEYKALELNSTISFDVNLEFNNLIDVKIKLNNGESSLITGSYNYTIRSLDTNLSIEFYDKKNMYPFDSLPFSSVLFESVNVNNKDLLLTKLTSYIGYDLAENEENFVISLDENIVNQYKLYYYTEKSSSKTYILQPTITLTKEQLGSFISISLEDGNSAPTVLYITFVKFNAINKIVFKDVSINNAENVNILVDENNEISRHGIYGFITDFTLEYKEGYEDCTFKIFNEQGKDVTSLLEQKSGIYTIKVYRDNEVITEYDIGFDYNHYYFFLEQQQLNSQERDYILLVTQENTLSKSSFEASNYLSNQSLTFNNKSTYSLVEGQNVLNAVYSVYINNVEYKYLFTMVVEYLPSFASEYVEDIKINIQNQYPIDFNDNLTYSSGSSSMVNLVNVTEQDIIITTKAGVSVLSKEIKLSTNYNYAYLEYKLSTSSGEKVFRAYIFTFDKVTDNVSVKIKFSDNDNSNTDITQQIQNNILNINAKFNCYINVDKDDYNQEVMFYKDGELYSTDSYLNVESNGTYVLKIISSSGKVIREITINITVDTTIFILTYKNYEFGLKNNEYGVPSGNVDVSYDMAEQKIIVKAYLPERDEQDTTSIVVDIQTIYADSLYLADGITKVTNLENLQLDIFTDQDGSVTGSAGKEYSQLRVITPEDQEGMDIDFYIIYDVEPEKIYPLDFIFDTNKDGLYNEEDFTCSLQFEMESSLDFGDFTMNPTEGLIINVTRQQLGIEEGENSVDFVVKWNKRYEDCSYQISLTDYGYETHQLPTIYAPTDENDNMVKLSLQFDNETNLGIFYFIESGTTQEELSQGRGFIPIVFILTD